jgi:hypothetical protein
VYGTSNVLWQYMIALVALAGCKLIMSLLIPDVPKNTIMIMERHKFISSKILDTDPLIINKDIKVQPNKIRYGIFKRYKF